MINEGTAVPLAWLAAVLVFTGTLVAFIFSTFETKSDAKEKDVDKEKAMEKLEAALRARLERMEDKLDRILER